MLDLLQDSHPWSFDFLCFDFSSFILRFLLDVIKCYIILDAQIEGRSYVEIGDQHTRNPVLIKHPSDTQHGGIRSFINFYLFTSQLLCLQVLLIINLSRLMDFEILASFLFLFFSLFFLFDCCVV